MKKLLFITLLITTIQSFAQVGMNTTSPHQSAILDITSTSKGFLFPRMTNAQKTAIVSPAAGLLVYCLDCGTSGEIQVYDGNKWVAVSGGLTNLVTYTTAGRTAKTNPTAGMQIFNTDRQCVETYDGTDWCCDDFYPLNTEVRTSKKFNGKAVFRKIFTGTIPNNAAETILFTVTECTGQIINYEGWIVQNGFDRRVSLESIFSGNVWHGPIFQFFRPAGVNIEIQGRWRNDTGDVRFQNCAYTITVEYTKN